jgi:hypothetical protein
MYFVKYSILEIRPHDANEFPHKADRIPKRETAKNTYGFSFVGK